MNGRSIPVMRSRSHQQHNNVHREVDGLDSTLMRSPSRLHEMPTASSAANPSRKDAQGVHQSHDMKAHPKTVERQSSWPPKSTTSTRNRQHK